MQFLYPSFLFALVALVIPVLIHLFNFRRYQKVYFSNVQFLKEIREQQSSRRNLKERLILASRLLALFFLIVAFARPYIPGAHTGNAGTQQAISVFIDNSYSMQTLNREGALLDEAKHRAKEIAAAYNMNDRFQLLTQDFEGKHQRLLSRDEFDDAVDAVKISPQSRNLQQIVNRQQSLLDMHAATKRAVYIVSDFQQNMAGSQPVKSEAGISISLVQLKANTQANVAVDSVWLLNAIHRPGESEKIVVRLQNFADENSTKVPLRLMINGSQKALGGFVLKAHSAQNDTLTFSGLQPGWQRGEIMLQDNPVTFDNQFYFTFNVKQQMPVLLIDGGTPNIYLKSVFAADPFFDVKHAPDGNIDYAALGSYPLIVMSDVKTITTGLAQQLKSYIAKGGTVCVFPAVDAELAGYQSFLQSVNASYPVKLVAANIKVSSLNLQNGVFKNIFEDFPQNPDLPVVKKYYQLSTAGGSAENLMQLTGGETFWGSYKFGRGKVYVSSVPLNEDYSSLPRHALFVPVMFRMALLSGNEQPAFFTLGHDESMEIPSVQTSEKQLLKLVKGRQSIIPDVRQQEGSTLLYTSDQLNETGIYDLKKQDSTIAVMAFNDNRSESNLAYFTAAELGKILPQATTVLEAGKGSLKDAVSDSNFGMQLWKLCIILALIFLAAEILLIKFYKLAEPTVLQPV
jgi:hypothetical protein